MALSMTGCGEGFATEGANTARIEMRCVNNRFLKVTLRAREGFAVLESRIEADVRERVRSTRGLLCHARSPRSEDG